jgi:hypothetical protein
MDMDKPHIFAKATETAFCNFESKILFKIKRKISVVQQERKAFLFSTRLPVHHRINANGNWHQMIYFPEIRIQ